MIKPVGSIICIKNFYPKRSRIKEALTLNDSKQDDNDEEEESDVEENAVNLVLVTVGGLDFVTDTTAGSHALV
jgi:hypothetical protein